MVLSIYLIYRHKGNSILPRRQKVFGRIEDFEMENGEPVTVKINVMEFIPDGIDDNNNPNGFRIEEDLEEE